MRLLKQVRQEAGLTQSQLAAKLGESQPYVSKYETGEQRLDLLEIEQICDAVGVGLITFMKRYLDDAKSEVSVNTQKAMG